jgi:hypothetical protein
MQDIGQGIQLALNNAQQAAMNHYVYPGGNRYVFRFQQYLRDLLQRVRRSLRGPLFRRIYVTKRKYDTRRLPDLTPDDTRRMRFG